MPLNKSKLRKVLGVLDPSLKGELTALQIKEDLSDNLVQLFKNFSNKITQMKSEVLESIEAKLKEAPDAREDMLAMKAEFDSRLAELEREEIPTIQTQMQDIVSNEIDAETLRVGLEQKVEDLRKDIFLRLRNIGGGQANRDIRFNSSVLSRYTDLNFITGSMMTIVTANNDDLKRTDITISSDVEAALAGGLKFTYFV